MFRNTSLIYRLLSLVVDFTVLASVWAIAAKLFGLLVPSIEISSIDPPWFGIAGLLTLPPYRMLCRRFSWQSPGMVAIERSCFVKKFFQSLSLIGLCVFGGISERETSPFMGIVGKASEIYSGWKTSKGSDHPYKVAFPRTPQESVVKIQLPGRDNTLQFKETRAITEEGIVYSLSYIDVPKRWLIFRAHTILGAALKVLSEQDFDAKIASTTKTLHGKHHALDFSIENAGTKQNGRLILAGNTLYRLMVITPEAIEADQHVEPFVNSFEAN